MLRDCCDEREGVTIAAGFGEAEKKGEQLKGAGMGTVGFCE